MGGGTIGALPVRVGRADIDRALDLLGGLIGCMSLFAVMVAQRLRVRSTQIIFQADRTDLSGQFTLGQLVIDASVAMSKNSMQEFDTVSRLALLSPPNLALPGIHFACTRGFGDGPGICDFCITRVPTDHGGKRAHICAECTLCGGWPGWDGSAGISRPSSLRTLSIFVFVQLHPKC